MTRQVPLVSIVCPAFHEQEGLPHFHAALGRVLASLEPLYRFEILYIDDGSRDATLEVMRQIAATDSRVRVLSLARNFGKEAALQAGLEHADGEFVVTMDTDLQHPPEVIPQLLDQMTDGVDLVLAVRERYHKPGWFHRLGTQVFYRVMHSLSEIEIPQDASDFLLMRRAVSDVLTQLPEKNRFVKGLIHWMGFQYREVTFRPEERSHGETKYHFRRLFALGKDFLIAFSNKPLTLATTFGLVTLLIGFLWLLAGLGQLVFGQTVPSWTEYYLIVSTHVIGGGILLAIGIVGEYLGRMWAQVRGRPHYVLKFNSSEASGASDSHQPPHLELAKFRTRGTGASTA